MVFGKHYNGYSSAIRSGIYNEVALAAFPAFLTMLPTHMVIFIIHSIRVCLTDIQN